MAWSRWPGNTLPTAGAELRLLLPWPGGRSGSDWSGRPLDLSVYGSMSFRAYRNSTQPGRFIYFGGLPDYEEMTFMKRFLRPGDGFIDGGANEGMFTLLAAQLVGPSGAVHAFEAVPEFAKLLAGKHRRQFAGMRDRSQYGNRL